MVKRISGVLLSACLLLSCEKKPTEQPAPDPNSGPVGPPRVVTGARYFYNCPSPNTIPVGAALEPLGSTYVGLSSAGPGLPLWAGVRFEMPSVLTWTHLARLDTAGRVLLTTRVLTDLATFLRATPDGGCWMGGGNRLVRLRADGSVAWATTVDYQTPDVGRNLQLRDLVLLADGSACFTGLSTLPNSSGQHILIGQIDAAGTVSWVREYVYPRSSADPFDLPTPVRLLPLSGGEFALLGTRSDAAGMFLTRFSATGQPLWNQAIGLSGRPTLQNLPNDGLQVVLSDWGTLPQTTLLRFEPSGTLRQSLRYTGLFQSPNGVSVNAQGETVLVGRTYVAGYGRGKGLGAVWLDAQGQPVRAQALDRDTAGRGPAELPWVVTPGGNYVYSLGDLSVPVNGGTPVFYGLYKLDRRGGDVCSYTADVPVVSVSAVTPTVGAASLPTQSAWPVRQASFTPTFMAFPLVQAKSCGR